MVALPGIYMSWKLIEKIVSQRDGCGEGGRSRVSTDGVKWKVILDMLHFSEASWPCYLLTRSATTVLEACLFYYYKLCLINVSQCLQHLRWQVVLTSQRRLAVSCSTKSLVFQRDLWKCDSFATRFGYVPLNMINSQMGTVCFWWQQSPLR